MHEVYALILAGGVGSRLSILTEQRAKPAVPFGGKFRIIDFALSNCANSGLFNVGLLTQYRPLSLIEHVGTGRVWDMDRSRGGLEILQPALEHDAGGWYQGTADAVTRNLHHVLNRSVEDVLILSGDHVYAMDYRPLLRFHRERRFPATIAVTPVPPEDTRHFGMVKLSSMGVITEFQEKPIETDAVMASMGVYVFRRDVLLKLLREDADDPDSGHDFGKDIFPRLIRLTDVGAHPYTGYWRDIGTVQAFYEDNLKILDAQHRATLNRPDWPILTPSVDAPPVGVRGDGVLSGSLAANGSVVRGRVERSILFPGVIVEPGARVTDAILMNDVRVGPGAMVHGCIVDKRVTVGEGSRLGGDGAGAPPNAELPDLLYSGLTIVGKEVHIEHDVLVGRNVCLGRRTHLPSGSRIEDGSFLG